MEDIIRKYALQNALQFGKADPKRLIGKVLGENPDLRSQVPELQKKSAEICDEINSLSEEDIKQQLESLAPELLEKKEKKEKDIFGFLKLNSEDKVNTGFPPGPEKQPHIGHAKSIIVNYELAKRQNGKFVLRFEDTNPALVKEEFYQIMQDDFKWLGVEWDELIYASDFMDLYYEKAEQLINQDQAYMCSCNPDQIREGRMKSTPCDCRNKSSEENLKEWQSFPTAKAGSAILRLKIELEHKNSTMRDPTIFRIIDEKHARTGDKYRVWPNYDFQNAIMDSQCGIDIRIRSKEFEMRNELQRWIQNALGLRETKTYEIARFNMEGVLSSGRVIREQIDEGKLIGWDDPSLTTIAALRRRGFQPEAIKNFVLSTGLTKSESTLTWDDLIIHNKRLLDLQSDRYFFVKEPVEITIKDAPEQSVSLKVHPEEPKRGSRDYTTKELFLLTKEDLDNIKDNELVRLMDCLNFIKEGNDLIFHSKDHEEFKKSSGKRLIHYLPLQDDLIDTEILMPNKEVVKGKASPYIKNVSPNQVIQFERFGFCKLDSVEDNIYKFWFTHK